MRRRRARCAASMLQNDVFAAVIARGASPPPPTTAPNLTERAILPADATLARAVPGRAEHRARAGARRAPAGRRLLRAARRRRRGSYLAMPDNGFGTKANSRSFLLRVYRVKPTGSAATCGSSARSTCATPTSGSRSSSSTRAPQERYLTGGDFDIESFRIDRRGTLWFGDEFGPFLLHTDATGKVLEAPIPLPGVRSPDYPATAAVGAAPNLAASNGFEGMAISPDGRTLYPTLEGPLADDADKTIRRCTRSTSTKRRYESGYRTYQRGRPEPTSSPTSRRSTPPLRVARARQPPGPRGRCTSRRSWSTRATAR